MHASAREDAPRAVVSLRGIRRRFGRVTAVDGIDLDIREGEFFALLGPSGCGKTTLLRIIAGLERPDAGRIFIDGADMTTTAPNHRPVNMVFQSYALFPHMTVAENVAYGLRLEGLARAVIAERVREALALVRLEGLEDRRPDALSGGQRQRVALARALVKRPRVLLLDEPLSALDARLREEMRLELSALQMRLGLTFVLVTHDQDEALSMADRIAVMRNGRIEQLDEPEGLYERPRNRFVAEFIGKINFFDSILEEVDEEGLRVVLPGVGPLSLPVRCLVTERKAADLALGDALTLAIRPEKIRISRAGDHADADSDLFGGQDKADVRLTGRIAEWAYYGGISHMIVEATLPQSGEVRRISVVFQNAAKETVEAFDIGDAVVLSWPASAMIVLTS